MYLSNSVVKAADGPKLRVWPIHDTGNIVEGRWSGYFAVAMVIKGRSVP